MFKIKESNAWLHKNCILGSHRDWPPKHFFFTDRFYSHITQQLTYNHLVQVNTLKGKTFCTLILNLTDPPPPPLHPHPYLNRTPPRAAPYLLDPLVVAMLRVEGSFLQRPELEGEARTQLLQGHFLPTLELVPAQSATPPLCYNGLCSTLTLCLLYLPSLELIPTQSASPLPHYNDLYSPLTLCVPTLFCAYSIFPLLNSYPHSQHHHCCNNDLYSPLTLCVPILFCAYSVFPLLNLYRCSQHHLLCVTMVCVQWFAFSPCLPVTMCQCLPSPNYKKTETRLGSRDCQDSSQTLSEQSKKNCTEKC